jgi:hypothetical protein
MRILMLAVISLAPVYAQWTEIPGTSLSKDLCPPDGFAGSVLYDAARSPYPYQVFCPAVISANGAATWNGGGVRKKAGAEQIVLPAQGGHTDYIGNEVYTVDLTGAGGAHRRTDPDTFSGADWALSSSPEALPFTNPVRPNSRHTYDGVTYVGSMDKIFILTGELGGSGGPGEARVGWLWDPVSYAWTKVTPNPAGVELEKGLYYFPAYGSHSVVWDKNTNLIYILESVFVFSLDLETSTYKQLSINHNTWFPFWPSRSSIDPIRRRILTLGLAGGPGSLGNGRVYVTPINPGSAGYGVTQEVTSSVDPACIPLISASGPGLDWNPDRSNFIGWVPNSGGTIYEIDPVSFRCTVSSFSGGPPVTATRFNDVNYGGTWGRFAYFPSLHAAYVMNDWGQDVFRFQFPASATNVTGTLPLAPPSVVSPLTCGPGPVGCAGFSSAGAVVFSCAYPDGSCGSLRAPAAAGTASGTLGIDSHLCQFGANLGAAPVSMGSLGLIPPASLAFDCTP